MSARVLVVSPAALHRDALVLILRISTERPLDVVVAEAHSPDELSHVDAVVVDTLTPDLDLLLQACRRQHLPVIVWGGLGTPWEGQVLRRRLSGEAGVIRLSLISRRAELAGALHHALRGDPPRPGARRIGDRDASHARVQGGLQLVPVQPVGAASTHEVALTRAELRAMTAYLVTQATCSRAEVAANLGISERTLKAHVANVRAKVDSAQAGTRLGLRRELQGRGLL